MNRVKMKQLCWTGTTLYGVDEEGYIWFIEMKSGSWALHGNPTMDDRAKELNRMEGKS